MSFYKSGHFLAYFQTKCVHTLLDFLKIQLVQKKKSFFTKLKLFTKMLYEYGPGSCSQCQLKTELKELLPKSADSEKKMSKLSIFESAALR
jgi:hypothetical protein